LNQAIRLLCSFSGVASSRC